MQSRIIPAAFDPILSESNHHFCTSFGSAARLDYGTGHELSFLAYLLILRLVGILKEEDEQAIVTRVFVAYLEVVRKLQKVYRLEPAGSKGVWGLDDHQHLVYLWGASQLKSESSIFKYFAETLLNSSPSSFVTSSSSFSPPFFNPHSSFSLATRRLLPFPLLHPTSPLTQIRSFRRTFPHVT